MEEQVIDMRRIIRALVTRWWLVLLLPTIGGLAAYFYSNSQEPTYQATASILVEYRGGGFTLGTPDVRRSQELASTYRRLATTRPFLQRVEASGAVDVKPGALAGMVSATKSSDPPIVNINVTDRVPEVAAKTAEAVAEEFIDFIFERRLAEISRLQTAAAAQGILDTESLVAAQYTALDNLSLLESVDTPGAPILPRTRQNMILGVLIGVVLAGGIIIFLESVHDRIGSPEELKRLFGVTSLGAVFRWDSKEVPRDGLVISADTRSQYAEAFRLIRTNIEFATVNHKTKVFLISSPGPGEGKTTVVSNLAMVFAQSGKRTVLVDCDLRRPSVHRVFALRERQPGLSNYLADMGIAIDDVRSPTDYEGVDIVPSGPTPPNPAELLSSPRMVQLLAELQDRYDAVFLDSPPLLPVADGSILASLAGGTILVLDMPSVRSISLRSALDNVRNAHADVIGVVANKLKRPRFKYGYAYYHYDDYYHSYTTYERRDDDARVNGTGRSYRRLTKRAKDAWSRLRSR